MFYVANNHIVISIIVCYILYFYKKKVLVICASKKILVYVIIFVNIISLFLYIYTTFLCPRACNGPNAHGQMGRPYLTGRKQALNGWAQPKKALEIGFLLVLSGLIWIGLDPTGPIWPDDPCDDESKRSL